MQGQAEEKRAQCVHCTSNTHPCSLVTRRRFSRSFVTSNVPSLTKCRHDDNDRDLSLNAVGYLVCKRLELKTRSPLYLKHHVTPENYGGIVECIT